MKNYIIGNQINTAQSQRACEIIIAPNFSGKKRYARPHTKPATAAAMISMKLNFDICTMLYIKVVTTKAISGLHFLQKLFCR
jgi:hypothetical protein